jgi:hypothetical protein
MFDDCRKKKNSEVISLQTEVTDLMEVAIYGVERNTVVLKSRLVHLLINSLKSYRGIVFVSIFKIGFFSHVEI